MTFFEKIRQSRTRRIVCACLAVNLVVELMFPTMAVALTSGPAQPEFTSFEPIATTDMVNEFTGDFTYNLPILNVPGPDGGGYSMSLSYHSGVSCEEEASWVGFGWSLNPGAINRSKRGYADEFNGVNVQHYSKTKPNWTQTAKFDFDMEYYSRDNNPSDTATANKGSSAVKFGLKYLTDPLASPSSSTTPASDDYVLSVSLAHTVRYNNYSGFSIANSVGTDAKNLAQLSLNRSGVQNTLGFSVSPAKLLRDYIRQKLKNARETAKQLGTGQEKATDPALPESKFKQKAKTLGYKALSKFGQYNITSYNLPALPYSVGKTAAAAWNFTGSIHFNPGPVFGYQVGIAGHMNVSATEGVNTVAAYGYMNSAVTNTNTLDNQVYDYQIENESTFNKNDKYLGIPYNTADIFSATGNGVMGGFRLQHDNIGSFYPNFSSSICKIRQLGVEIGFGTTNQVGLDVGVGKQITTVSGKWPKHASYTGKEFSTTAPKMRFTNDPGGETNYGDNYGDLQYAAILQNKTLDLGPNFNLAVDHTKNQSSSYIEYAQETTTNTINKSINAITITNKDGGKNNYGIPVYTKNEVELTTGISVFNDGNMIATQSLDINNPLNNKIAVGQKTADKYASAYLLTCNTACNYIDADATPGPSAGDFGGWTKFDYRQAYGGAGTWYHFRSPYTGLRYNAGRVQDPTDQTGTMSSGDKEIYYLKCIETKSHIAFFVTNKTRSIDFSTNFPSNTYGFLYNTAGNPISTVTANIVGSGASRYDGLDAAFQSSVATLDPAAGDLTAKGANESEKLERIVLFSKADLSKPLTTTYFKYDNSLCPGIPNTTSGSPLATVGKLTLKKIWTESNGVARNQVAPYQFHYEYFHQYESQITAKYTWANDFNNNYINNDANQNPNYTPWCLDAWGFYQEQGDKRIKNMQSWLSQMNPGADAFSNTNNPGNSANFDPAAWQLKRIQLPSGGEIHIQYEQKDYSSLQDKVPTAMVSLIQDGSKDTYTSDDNVFCINTRDVVADENINDYYAMLKNYFQSKNNKLYFKMLYAFIGDEKPLLNTENRRFEYVTGYTTVNAVTLSSGKILFQLGDIRTNHKSDKTLPRYVCYQELETNGGHNLGPNSSSYKNDDLTDEDYAHSPVDVDDLKYSARHRVLTNTILMFADWATGKVKNAAKNKACRKLNFDLSYFKLPVYKIKKGGGIRVKRLLTYDPGISGESGGAMIYGSEYVYRNEDGTSSGVAVNEPAAMREESALVSFMERKKQKFFDKITNGRDTKQFEGPIGENLLPGAAVVHSRIIIKNIHEGRSAPGFAVNTYHTAKEYPVQVEYSDLSKAARTYRKFNMQIPLPYFTLGIHKTYVTQGYLFKLNDMNGKIAGRALYPGNYDQSTFREDLFASKTTYEYSQPGDKVQSILYDAGTNRMNMSYLNPGTEEDFTIFTSTVKEAIHDFSTELDFNFSIPIEPSFTRSGGFSYTDNQLCQHITTKVLSQASHLLSTTTIADGVTQTTKNLAFDRYTNEPVLTQTYDSYNAPFKGISLKEVGATSVHNGYYYALNIPASWMYTNMGPKSINSSNSNQLTSMAGNVVTYSTNTMYDKLLATGTWSPNTNNLLNVVSASATTYTMNWFNSAMSSEFPNLTGAALTQANTLYYPIRTYNYLDNVQSANATNGKIYSAGYIPQPFKFFNWITAAGSGTVDPQWFSDTRVIQYSPNGYPLEEEDVLGIRSAARFGYNDQLPVLIAQNSAYSNIKFTDFEYSSASTSTVSIDPYITTRCAHSGLKSLLLSAEPGYVFVSAYNFSQQTMNHGVSIKLWLKSMQMDNLNYGLKNPLPKLKAVVGGKKFDFTAIAQTGEWTLYSTDMKAFTGLAPGVYDITLDYNYIISSPSENVYVDDFRIQPLDASVNCSVYYPNNKLAAQFDDQHFGIFYEYNSKGEFVRKSIETERGKKILQEQQYNTPLINIQ